MLSLNGAMDQQQGKSFGRADLVAKLQERGLSRRRAVRVINVILDCMTAALRRGEPVEFPFGWLGRLNLRYRKWFEYIDVSPPYFDADGVIWQVDAAGARQLEPGRWAPVLKRRRRGRSGLRKTVTPASAIASGGKRGGPGSGSWIRAVP